MNALWLVVSAMGLALAWLLPNHSPPWSGFHGDAWAACMLTVLVTWLNLKKTKPSKWYTINIGVACMAIVPWAQYVFGLIPLFGTAWINSLFIIGLVLAIQAGGDWEDVAPDQCANFLFLAVVFAAGVSTALATYQWIGGPAFGAWTLYAQNDRMYANFAQPNLLASLLLLAVIGISWAYVRNALSARVAIVLTIFILFGIALTASRTAWLNLALCGCCLIVWRKDLPSRAYAYVSLGLLLYFVAVTMTLPMVNAILTDESSGGGYRSMGDPTRLNAWKMFLAASWLRPWSGYGWGQVVDAMLLMAGNDASLIGFFSQSHNFLLDLILWNGYPVGLAFIALILCWGLRVVRGIKNFQQLHIMLFLMVLAVHAMLEFPLHYAYFLLPFGMMMGVLQTGLGFPVVFRVSKWTSAALVILCGLALWFTVTDYLKIERSFYGLRFEAQGIPTDIPKALPDVLVLTQFSESIKVTRSTPRSGMSEDSLRRMDDAVRAVPSAQNMLLMAASYALNGKPTKAHYWLQMICQSAPGKICVETQQKWEASSDPAIRALPWPAH